MRTDDHSTVGRRFQRYGEVAVPAGGKFTLIDDYGHHPVEMAATLAAAVPTAMLATDAIARIMAAQATRAQRRAAADWVIYNDGLDLAGLRQEVLSISAWLQL